MRLPFTLNRKRVLIATGGAILILIIVSIFLWKKSIIVTGGVRPTPTLAPSVLTGAPCAHPDRRPIAVMLASDPEARPLSGLSDADVVFEMPVTPTGMPRLMAIFQCNDPQELGSVRSAREDFIPLAQGLDAILAHWGGESEALEHLNRGVINNIDAMKYEGTVFTRKTALRPPHNGFTDMEKLLDKARSLTYTLEWHQTGFPHSTDIPPKNISTVATGVSVPYPSPFAIRWSYNAQTHRYQRMRDGAPEIDYIDSTSVTAGTVIVMETTSKFIRDQYISVQVIGQGKATIYKYGASIGATWRKDTVSSQLVFIDGKGQEIPLAPGPLWIEIITF